MDYTISSKPFLRDFGPTTEKRKREQIKTLLSLLNN
jgi:hypothetical protein